MNAIQVVDSRARYTNGEMNFACQIYIGCNATQLWDTETEAQMGCMGAQNEQAPRGLVKAPLKLKSPLELAKVDMKAISSVPTKYFGTTLASILAHLSYLFCNFVFQLFLLPFGVG